MENAYGRFWRDERKRIAGAIAGGQTVAVTGLYGAGKNLLASLVREMPGISVIGISFKDMPRPERKDVYAAFWDAAKRTYPAIRTPVSESDFSFHYGLKRLIEADGNSRPVVFVIEEAQNIVHLPDSFFDALESLRYYLSPRVAIVLFGDPRIRQSENAGLARLVGDEFIYLKPFSARETADDVDILSKRLGYPLGKYAKTIHSVSGGHHGTIKYICQHIAKHRFTGRLTVSKFREWCIPDPMLPFFLATVWDGFAPREKLFLGSYFSGHAKDTNSSAVFRDLEKLGVLRIRAGEMSCLVSPYVPFMRKLLSGQEMKGAELLTLGDKDILVRGEPSGTVFTYQERLVLRAMLSRAGIPVPYDDLGRVVWGDRPDGYSLAAMAKVVSRIRNKMLAIGVPSTIIRTVPKLGYMAVP